MSVSFGKIVLSQLAMLPQEACLDPALLSVAPAWCRFVNITFFPATLLILSGHTEQNTIVITVALNGN
eukprot:m.50573 g.50573  ORF g.50573 m.50573 type:complete len:68 (+) comp10679_c1_seq1:2410-2613(+)